MNYLLIFILFVTITSARSRHHHHHHHHRSHHKNTEQFLNNKVHELEKKISKDEAKIHKLLKFEHRTENNLAETIKSATSNNDLKSVSYLIDLGASVDSKFTCNCLKGKSLLHIAAEKGFVEILEEFIKRGGDVNIVDEDGKSPLYYAAYNGQRDTAKLLLDSGANGMLKNKEGKTPYDVAISRGKKHIAEEIRSHFPEIKPVEYDEKKEQTTDEPHSQELITAEVIVVTPISVEPLHEEPIAVKPLHEEPIAVKPYHIKPIYLKQNPITRIGPFISVKPRRKVDPDDEERVDQPLDNESDDDSQVEESHEETPLDEEPLDEEPLDEEPLDEEPLDEEPLDEEPLDEEPHDEEPLDEEPLDEEPLDPEPLAGEPIPIVEPFDIAQFPPDVAIPKGEMISEPIINPSLLTYHYRPPFPERAPIEDDDVLD